MNTESRSTHAALLAPFYLIVDKVDALAECLPLGVRCVQLRIKDQSAESVRAQLREALALMQDSQCRLIVNDYWQIAIEEGASAVHLGQEDLAEADLTAIKNAGLALGVSTHDRAELQLALAAKPDYIALGPIYATLLKKMPWQPQGLDKLARWKSRVGELPLVAIGGFTPERAAGAFAHGADSVCVVTDVAQHADPAARIREWLRVTNELAH